MQKITDTQFLHCHKTVLGLLFSVDSEGLQNYF